MRGHLTQVLLYIYVLLIYSQSSGVFSLLNMELCVDENVWTLIS